MTHTLCKLVKLQYGRTDSRDLLVFSEILVFLHPIEVKEMGYSIVKC